MPPPRMLVGRRQDPGHSPAQPMAITFLLLLNSPHGRHRRPTPKFRLNSKQQLGESGSTFRARGGGEKPTAGEDQGPGDRQIQAPIPAQPPPSSVPWGRLLNRSRLNFLICEMVTEVVPTPRYCWETTQTEGPWYAVGAQSVRAKSLQSHPTL